MKSRAKVLATCLGVLLLLTAACNTPMPKPRGMLRIDLPAPQYAEFAMPDRPYTFRFSRLANVELPAAGEADDRLNIAYPKWGVTIYCSSVTGSTATLSAAADECRELVRRGVRDARAVTERIYEDPAARVYGVLFRIEGDSPAPIRFMLTDSASRFFQGALYYPDRVRPDSVAPLTDYFARDVAVLIETFRWK